MSEPEQDRISKALVFATYGPIDGSHHRDWVIDQMVRALLGEGYEAWVAERRAGEDGPETYLWPEGIAP